MAGLAWSVSSLSNPSDYREAEGRAPSSLHVLRIRILAHPPVFPCTLYCRTRAPLPSSDKEGAISIPMHNNGRREGGRDERVKPQTELEGERGGQ